MARQPRQAPAEFRSEAMSLRQLLSLGRFEPARVQREYQWDQAQWRDLLFDLTNAFRYADLDPGAEEEVADPDRGEESTSAAADEEVDAEPPRATLHLTPPPRIEHFYLGHLILLQRQSETQFFIYDGQQRLTTLTLLLCGIRDAIGNAGDWMGPQSLLRTQANEARLTLRTRGSALARIVQALNGTVPGPTQTNLDAADLRIYGAAKYFRNSLKAWSPERRQAFLDYLLDRVFVSATLIKDRRVAEYAYITVNTRGRALQNKDIIKGHFTQLGTLRSLADANRLAEKWDSNERAAGKYFGHALQMVFMMELRRAPAFDFGAQLMDVFQDESNVDDAIRWVSERLPEFVAWHKVSVLGPQQKTVLGAPEARIRRLAFLPWPHWQAIAFRLSRRYRTQPDKFSQQVKALEQWCYCANLLDLDETKLTDVVLAALRTMDENRSPFAQGAPLCMSKTWKERVKSRLEDGQVIDDERRGAHVRWLETLLWPDAQVNFIATKNTSVEHVLPQRPAGRWLTDFPQAIHIHAEQFGNLCLIPKELNQTLGASEYPAKREAFLRLPSTFRSAHDVAQQEQWTMAAVQGRTTRLKALAVAALGL